MRAAAQSPRPTDSPRIAILFQEEPVFLGPFLRDVIARRPECVVAVFHAGRRSGGERRRTWRERLRSLRTYWLVLEPRGFLLSIALRLRSRFLGPCDPRSVVGVARRFAIPVYSVSNPNSKEFRALLRRWDPDVVLNQSELVLRRDILSVPRLGFLNRHASLLPHFRGRLASFWSHAAEPSEYGFTFHRISEELDAGPIVLQHRIDDIDPRWSYPRVIGRLMRDAADRFWTAIEILGSPNFTPRSFTLDEKPKRFPRLGEARRYREVLAERRSRRAR